MAFEKLALIRYQTLDHCFQDQSRNWALEDLIRQVSAALSKHGGISDGVSKRTIQADIQWMRNGYNAPIVVQERKFYTYADKEYSIRQVSGAALGKLADAITTLRQLEGFAGFPGLEEVIVRLENTLHRADRTKTSLIQPESDSFHRGISNLLPLYEAVSKKIPVLITYRSLRAREPRQEVYHPYLLKEFRGDWFLVAKSRKAALLTILALDRIVEVLEMNARDFVPYTGQALDEYFGETIGVTRTATDTAQKVVLWVNRQHAPHVLTKPIHASQQLLSEDQTGILIRLDVVLNVELEREILGFGENIKVFAPGQLQQRIKRRLHEAVAVYEPVSRPADKMQDVHPEEE